MACAGCQKRRLKIQFWFRRLIAAAHVAQVEKYLRILDLHQHDEFGRVGKELTELRARVGHLERLVIDHIQPKEYKISSLKDG